MDPLILSSSTKPKSKFKWTFSCYYAIAIHCSSQVFVLLRLFWVRREPPQCPTGNLNSPTWHTAWPTCRDTGDTGDTGRDSVTQSSNISKHHMSKIVQTVSLQCLNSSELSNMEQLNWLNCTTLINFDQLRSTSRLEVQVEVQLNSHVSGKRVPGTPAPSEDFGREGCGMLPCSHHNDKSSEKCWAA